jgi:hypothetical protein
LLRIKSRFSRMLRLIFEKKYSFKDIESKLSEKDWRFFESTVLAWKDKTLHMWAVEAINQVFRERAKAEDQKKSSGYLNLMMGYLKTASSDRPPSKDSLVDSYFHDFSTLLMEDEKQLFEAKDTSLDFKLQSLRLQILDKETTVSLNLLGPVLGIQINDCFRNFNFSVRSVEGTEVTPLRVGSKHFSC